MNKNTVDGNVVYDDLAWKLAGSLLEDFKPFVGQVFYDAAKLSHDSRNVAAWRALTCGQEDHLTPYQLKTQRQIVDLFKKFSFSTDVYTPEDLQKISTDKFMENQRRLASFTLSDEPLVRDVLWRAKGWCELILGDFDPLEVCKEATFGKKSSVGVPMRLACEGARYEPPITGSAAHCDWFTKYYCSWNRPAFRYASSLAESLGAPLTKHIDCLEAVLVDKTWKSLRMIMPNTTLGTLYSSGLGRVLEDRLRKFGYDIRHLQPVHGELARFGSITGSLVTADQSMASDNITTTLVTRIFPRSWASALDFGRISRMTLNGSTFETPTYCTMGIGFTFPLQTLIFLVLLLAIRDTLNLGEETVVSVYGDDLIYAVEMHDLVVDIFPKLGLVLNIDKTFATGHFRESCGQDYFRGFDVRPAHLGRARGTSAYKRRAEAYLYKTFNALAQRWSAAEIDSTYRWLLQEITALRGGKPPLYVPSDFPATSGIKHREDFVDLFGLRPLGQRNMHGQLSFRYLAFEPKTRAEPRHIPYLFQRLRTASIVESIPGPRGHGDVLSEVTEILMDEDHPDGGTYRSKLTGKREPIQHTVIPQQDAGKYRERTRVTGNWTP